jgi:Fe-S-cluster containining protein
MNFDFQPFFERYEKLAKKAGTAFEQVKQEHPDCVNCELECSDCCHALFDLTFIEALYINTKFNQTLREDQKRQILKNAETADREIYRLKKKAYREYEGGKEQVQILEEMAEKRVRCPFLTGNNHCQLYEFRPMTCRLYGIPTSIGGKGHTCGKSGFREGCSYPTVNLDVINRELYQISHDLVQALRSRYSKMGDMLVPLSMALLTEYTADYLGIEQERPKKEEDMK